MKGLCCRNFWLICVCLYYTGSYGQSPQPRKQYNRSDLTEADSTRLAAEYGGNKTLIPAYTLQTLIALSYFPELKNSRIRFVLKATRSPLQTKPVFPNLLGSRSKRKFAITISDSSIVKLEPLLLERMDFNAQVGVIGHELSHASDFSNRSAWSLIGSGIGHLSSKYIDRFEYRTDSICIAHGLGFQLLAWSRFVRATLHSENYDGSDNIDMPVMDHERYMNPSTILTRMEAIPIYTEALQK
ncbi:MAG TPA: hypothetical protein VMI35_02795 [Puia sp.]|nr:hypothetical protein [Puia sp.]